MKSRKKSNKFNILCINFVSLVIVIYSKFFINNNKVLLFYSALALFKKIVLKIFKGL